MTTEAPLILTLALDEAAFHFFNQLRQEHFPAERNYLKAHLTLFHHLPGAEQSTITQYLTEVSQDQPPLSLAVSEVRSLGSGVAYRLVSQELQDLHRRLSEKWQAWLTPQDQQTLWPHVTVQNKVSKQEAQALYQQLNNAFEPFTATGTGLQLWEYQAGPWELLEVFDFS